MYAHQVIEDFKILLNVTTKHWLAVSLGAIASSQKFHMGDVEDIAQLTENITKDININKYIKLPYAITWIEFTMTDPKYDYTAKYGCLLSNKENENDLILTIFIYDHKKNTWSFYPYVNYITKGNEVYYHAYHIDQPKTSNKIGLYPLDWINLNSEDKHVLQQLTAIALRSLLILNCKNLQTETIKAPEALNKKRIRHGKQPIFDYHVLNVVVPSRKAGYSEKAAPISHNRVHLCRGHFKEYTQERPLMGKHTGLYWWQPHVRGQNKDGIVMKDYTVTAGHLLGTFCESIKGR